jgi:hypothetical protein
VQQQRVDDVSVGDQGAVCWTSVRCVGAIGLDHGCAAKTWATAPPLKAVVLIGSIVSGAVKSRSPAPKTTGWTTRRYSSIKPIVVGVHFLALAAAWRVSLFRRLGTAIALCGAAAITVASAGAGAAWAAGIGGVLPGGLLLWAAIRQATAAASPCP